MYLYSMNETKTRFFLSPNIKKDTSFMSLIEDTLKSHNDVRAREGKPGLLWCDECAKSAQRHADELARTGTIAHGLLHDSHGQMGQNIAMGGKAFDIKKAVAYWVQEQGAYVCGRGGCGHYTQVVWKGTTHVGTGTAKVGNRTIVVSNYHPPGNWAGMYRDNV